MCYNKYRKKERAKRFTKKEVNKMTKVITINIIKDMDTYDTIMDYVKIYDTEWYEDGTVVMTVDAIEYDEIFGEEI